MDTPPLRIHSLGPRIPLQRRQTTTPSAVLGMRTPSRILPRKETESCSDPNLCEKPISQKDLAIPIALGIACVASETGIKLLKYTY